MSRLNDPQNFAGRVAYAAKIIAYGGSPSRAFDNCFENHDGDEVATVIVRRARRNPKIASNLHRYLNMASVEAAALRLADVPTRKLSLSSPEKPEPTRRPSSRHGWRSRIARSPLSTLFSHDPTTEGRA